jgi:glycosyltransferase involved in cell wall biosynthesis
LAPPAGGIATHVADVARLLERHGIRHQVLVPRRTGAFFAELAGAGRKGVVHAHVHGHSTRAWLLAALCSSARRGVLTVHSGLAPEFVAQHAALVRAATCGYAAIVCVSRTVREAMVRAGVPLAHTWIAPAFLAETLEQRVCPAGWRAMRRAHRTLLAAAVAPAAEYGTPLLLSAFGALRQARPDLELGLALFGPGAHVPKHAGPGIHLLGELRREEALAVIAEADLFVRPTLADGDAISVREALALGRRVVASDAVRRPPGVQLHRTGDGHDLKRAIEVALAAPAPRVLVDQSRETLLAIYAELGAAAEPPMTPASPLPRWKEGPCAASQGG